MDWNVVNGIAGIVSAICAVVSLSYLGFERIRSKDSEPSQAIRSFHKFMSFVLASSGWALCCLAVLWIFEPYGCCPTRNEYRQFYGIVLGFPALVIFLAGVALLRGKEKT